MLVAAWALLVQSFALGLFFVDPASAEGFTAPICSGHAADEQPGAPAHLECACCFLCVASPAIALPVAPSSDPGLQRIASILRRATPPATNLASSRFFHAARARGPPEEIS